jgi:hypothetical protein
MLLPVLESMGTGYKDMRERERQNERKIEE